MSRRAVIFINIIGTVSIVLLFLYIVKGELNLNRDISNKQINSSIRENITQIDKETQDTIAVIKGKDPKKTVNSPDTNSSKIDDDSEMPDSFDYRAKNPHLATQREYILSRSSQNTIPQPKERYNTPESDVAEIDINSNNTIKSSEKNTTEESENDSNNSNSSDTNNRYNPYEWAVEWPLNNDKNLSDYNSSNQVDNETIEDIIESIGGDLGNLVLIRIFKEEKRLELWMSITGKYRLLKSYKIISYSGILGPKLSDNDGQSPEGYYSISNDGLILDTSGYIKAELIFPNKYDQEHNITDGYASIHDKHIISDGFTLSDIDMKEIYEVLNSSFANGYKAIPVYIYPFVMSEENINSVKDNPWIEFWKNIKGGYDYFMHSHRTPAINVIDGKYIFHVL